MCKIKVFASIVVHTSFPLIWYARWPHSLIWYATWSCFEKFNFYPLIPHQGFYFIWFYSLRPIYKRSVMQGWVFLGWTTTKLGLMFFAKDHNAVTPVRLELAALRSRFKHSTTEPLRSPHQGYHTAACVIPLKLICNMPKFWKKVDFWPFDPNPRVREGGGGLRAKYLLLCCCILDGEERAGCFA